MSERPILFSDAMVRAILDGAKTQTRRLVRYDGPQSALYLRGDGALMGAPGIDGVIPRIRCPYGVPGDRLWVREKHQAFWIDDQRPDLEFAESKGAGWRVRYPSTDGLEEMHIEDKGIGTWCRPSIHMPRWASRITLELTDVRAERLQDISEDDARAEGAIPGACDFPAPWVALNAEFDSAHTLAFSALWDSINGERAPWVSNPWVWALTFKRGGV